MLSILSDFAFFSIARHLKAWSPNSRNNRRTYFQRCSKEDFRLLTHRLQIFLVKYEYLRSLQLCDDQGILEKLKKGVCNHVLAILTTYMETRLKRRRWTWF